MNPVDTQLFEEQRRALVALAYQMVGERAAAEDIVQDTWLAWNKADKSQIHVAAAWLRRVCSRLAIDFLKSARVKREVYVGPWLPEPLLSSTKETPGATEAPDDHFELAKECELALVWAMERLSPEERAAFILRKVFDADYSELADMLNRSDASCRKIVSRASQKLRDAKIKFDVDAQSTEVALQLFAQACAAADHEAVKRLLAPNVVALSDGGGKARAALRPLVGADEVAHVFLAIVAKTPTQTDIQAAIVNGRPALRITATQDSNMITTVRLDDKGLIAWIYTMRNPDKLPT